MAGARTMLLAAVLLSPCAAAHAQHISGWWGVGLGSFVFGGSGVGDPNWSRLGAVAISAPGDRFGLRWLKGSLERPRGIPPGVGDDDCDYYGFDALVTGKATGLPVDLAVGVTHYEEAYHLGYPGFDLGGKEYVHRWGPHVAALRWWPAGRFGQLWAEADLHYAPYQPRQLVLFLDVGIGLGL